LNDASVALAARIVLAAALTVSALAKLRSRAAVQQQVALLVSDALAPVLAPALPAAELLVAVALVVWWSPVPGVVALVLLAAFTVVLVRAQARRVPCLCFGAAAVDAPVGPAAIVRNGVLAALAVLAIGTPTGARPGATIGIGVVLGAVTALVVRMAR
jgi:Methylamine utilisation protein MauE